MKNRDSKWVLYSRGTQGGGALVKSTSSGGGTTATSSSGGGSTQTSSSGGGIATSTQTGGATTQTSSSGGGTSTSSSHTAETQEVTGVDRPGEAGNHYHNYYSRAHNHTVVIPNHTHSTTLPAHSHDFEVPNHSHSIQIPNHTHSVQIPNHSHDVQLPDHAHELEHGIFTLDRLPTAVEIKVDGNLVPHSDIVGANIDLIPYLAKDENGKISRGRWHQVTIRPNDLGRVNANIISQVFIQSRGGGKH
ncbi:hypothetical protein [Bacillus sp. CHD6a]|uniref:hypothetical protein n=1 Tax=Bacillus sp. CHD6a TaxID=1643452 RepID=UPI000760F97D|nr:hypothetical protein [Bacillus sp. CHD6a]